MTKVLTDVMANLQHSEINCSVRSFYDGGFTVLLGDEMNGFDAEKQFRTEELGDAAEWLHQKALELYPNSVYTQRNVAKEA